MHIKSLGIKTEMIFHRFDSMIEDRGTYIAVKTPQNPNFYFGNLLIFPDAPRIGSLAEWQEIFRTEFADIPEVKHFTFMWDTSDEGIGHVEEFERAEFKVEHSVVLTASKVHPPKKMNSEVSIRPITTDSEWHEVTESQIRSKSADYDEATYRPYKELQMARYRTMSEQGLGHWFGAFMNEVLVADLGIYSDGTLGRFQSVETHPDYQRQGICGRLVYESAQFAFDKMGITKLVMVADEHYHAAKIYESVGFIPTSKEYAAFWWKKEKE